MCYNTYKILADFPEAFPIFIECLFKEIGFGCGPFFHLISTKHRTAAGYEVLNGTDDVIIMLMESIHCMQLNHINKHNGHFLKPKTALWNYSSYIRWCKNGPPATVSKKSSTQGIIIFNTWWVFILSDDITINIKSDRKRFSKIIQHLAAESYSGTFLKDQHSVTKTTGCSPAPDVIYTSRAYAMMPVSVCLWRLCIVVTGCNGSRISLHAWIDGCLCYLLTTPHPDRRMGWCQDFWWKWGGMEKLVIVVISLIWLTESLDQKHVTHVCLYQRYVDIFIIVRVISVENALYLKNGLC